MNTLLRPAAVLLALLTLLTGLLYPLAVTGLAQVVFPGQANGSLMRGEDDHVLGSALIGQPFSDPRYFWGRPSATTPFPYNAAASSGSNLGPSNPALVAAVQARIAALHAVDPNNDLPVPVDLVTASASGLDPDVSVAAALYQAPRVARLRGLDVEAVRQLIARYTEDRQLGFLGEPRVKVLKLNLALDGVE
jgi:K+-transporting ATPase ATPase C chain